MNSRTAITIHMALLAFVMNHMGVCAAASDQDFAIARGGKPQCVIVVPANAAEDELLAAQEIQTYVRKITGAELEIVEAEAQANRPAIRVGLVLSPAEAKVIQQKSSDPAAFIIRVSTDEVVIAGLSPEGTLFGAYEMLEQVGVRWYIPGELGEVVPSTDTVTAPIATKVHAPSFTARHLQMANNITPWYRRQKFGGIYFSGRHGIPVGTLGEGDEEMRALVNGQRKASRHQQLCISNPEVLKRTIAYALQYFDNNPDEPMIGMGPNDGGGFCECDNCQALDSGDWDPYSAERSMTDRYIWFFNRVLEAIHEKHPGKKLGFYCYHTYMLPPTKWKPNPSIVPAFAPITFCRVHGVNNPQCSSRAIYRDIVLAWSQLVPEMYERGYFNNLACPDLPFSKVQAIRDEIPFAHKAGIKGWRVESFSAWVPYATTFYIAGRLMWDVETDVDAVLEEFYVKFFGPAAEPMGAYLTIIDHGLRDTDSHVGGSYVLLQVFNSERRQRSKQLLAEAKRLAAGDPVVAQRVALYQMNHDRLEAFLQMIDSRNRFDFTTSKKALDTMRTLTDELISYRLYPNPAGPTPLPEGKGFRKEARPLWTFTARNYLRRFWAACTEQGFERVVTNGQFVAGFPDEWLFKTDPEEVGDGEKWFSEEHRDDGWKTLRTLTATWGDQGFYDYKGVAWYRGEIKIPTRFEDRPIYLWFGGIDEKATVWINGKHLGDSKDPGRGLPGVAGAFRPVEFDASTLLRVGQVNTVAVKIENRNLDELGTGGIVAPVMFWSPRPRPNQQDGREAK